MTQVVKASDGRRLTVECSGAPDGKPVFLLHGTPGGRNGPRRPGIACFQDAYYISRTVDAEQF